MNKIDKSLATLTTRWREMIRVSKIRDEKGDITRHQGNTENHKDIH